MFLWKRKKYGASTKLLPQMNKERRTQRIFEQLLIVSSNINHDRKYLCNVMPENWKTKSIISVGNQLVGIKEGFGWTPLKNQIENIGKECIWENTLAQLLKENRKWSRHWITTKTFNDS